MNVEDLIATLNQFSQEDSAASNSSFVYVFEAHVGRKYTKITHGYAGSRSAWCFIDAEGNLWKPATYNAPTKNFSRGKVQDLYNKQFVLDHIYGF